MNGGQPLAGLNTRQRWEPLRHHCGGGKPGCNYIAVGCGVVFKVDSSGNETVLYSFGGGTDGGTPESPLIRDSSGNLYGMTSGGGRQTLPYRVIEGLPVCSNLGHVTVGTAFITFQKLSKRFCEQVRFCQKEPAREFAANSSPGKQRVRSSLARFNRASFLHLE